MYPFCAAKSIHWSFSSLKFPFFRILYIWNHKARRPFRFVPTLKLHAVLPWLGNSIPVTGIISLYRRTTHCEACHSLAALWHQVVAIMNKSISTKRKDLLAERDRVQTKSYFPEMNRKWMWAAGHCWVAWILRAVVRYRSAFCDDGPKSPI